MTFLGKISSAGARFLGGVSKGARFIAGNVGNIQKGARAVSSFAHNPTVQRLGQHIGIKPNVFRQVGSIAGQAANNLPGSLQAASNAVDDGKRNIGALYSALTK